jgi:AcrR family transcriptional regulator
MNKTYDRPYLFVNSLWQDELVSEAVQDGRLLRGAQSRRTIVRHAVDVASLDGLDGLSFGRLATDLGLSKGGIQTLFGTKENLQVAVVEAAREVFEAAVIRPALTQPSGAARLSALVDRWIAYAEKPLLAGGCFWAANLPVFDSQPGPVRDTLVRQQRAWRGLIADQLRQAADAGDIAALDADLVAFQIDAVLTATNTALRLGDDNAVDTARRVIDGFLAPRG